MVQGGAREGRISLSRRHVLIPLSSPPLSTSPQLKIGTVSAQKETDPETHETAKKVEQDRLPHIDAAVVRVMKTRKVLDHNGLILEVTKQLSQRRVGFFLLPRVFPRVSARVQCCCRGGGRREEARG